jgi:hypothetical protein
MQTKFKYIAILSFFAILISTNSCTIGGKGWSAGYSFGGVNVSSDIKSAGVAHFQNNAPQIQPQMAQKLTEKLKDKITSQTRLTIANGLNGDVNFEGIIVDYSTQPVAPQGGAVVTAALNRLTIKVSVKYTNSKDSKTDYEQEFSRYYDFPASQNLTTVENSDKKYEDMLDELITDIFNRAFVNW